MATQLSLFSPSSTKPAAKNTTRSATSGLSVFVDGAARGNPGPAGAGIFITQDKTTVLAEGLFLGKKTNNQAEYLALLLAIFFIEKLIKDGAIAHQPIRFFSDSELLVKQMNGVYQVKNEQLKALHGIIRQHLTKHHATFTHVLRAKNADADALANLGVDHKKKVPTAFSKILADYGLHL